MSNLLNRSQIKKFILAKVAQLRPGMEERIIRVSKTSLDHYESQIRNIIEHDIMTHPSLGKTFNVN